MRAAGEALIRLAELEEEQLERRQTLASLSKLAFLAQEATAHEASAELLRRSEELLYTARLQERLKLQGRVLSPRALLDHLLSDPPIPLERLLLALDLYRHSGLQRLDTDAEILLGIWRRALEGVDWQRIWRPYAEGRSSDQALEAALRQTVFFEAARHPSVRDLLPPAVREALATQPEVPQVDPRMLRVMFTLIDSTD
jgi:hypothetical protein